MEVAYVTIGNPAFCLTFYLTGVFFLKRVTARWSRRWAKSQLSTIQNLRNSWCQIVRRTICLLSIHYLTLATLFDYAVPVYTCEMFCFPRHDPYASHICVDLFSYTFLVSREKNCGEVWIFSWNHDVWMFDILNEHDGMQQFSF